jgi:lysophospholipase L1-like esterase
LALSVFSFFLFAFGFLLGVKNVMSPNGSALPELPVGEAARAEEKSEGVRLVALGDSLTRGIGDEDGGGFVGVLKEAKKGQWIVQNLGVSGATSDDLLEMMKTRSVQYALSVADVITMTIGGNDLFRGSGELVAIDDAKYEKTAETFKGNLVEILTTIRALNPHATVYVIGLYNPFAGVDETNETTRYVHDWNYRTQLIIEAFDGAVFVPIADLFGKMPPLAADRFHPDNDGYTRIGKRLLEVIQK